MSRDSQHFWGTP